MTVWLICLLLSLVCVALAVASLVEWLLAERNQSQMRRLATQRAVSDGQASTLVTATALGLKNAIPAQPLLRLPRKPSAASRGSALDAELPALLDICALGMRSGLAFDQAFSLAVCRSSGKLAGLCRSHLDIWQKGLCSREQGLRQLEAEVNTELFSRFVGIVLRALRSGAPVAPLLLSLTGESRQILYAKREEQVAKAPVKMLLPTGGLILPAMLLLVLGPILLDLMEKLG
ncbi:MAG: type II secretion system F family protein [Actinomycetia bacterium]|nr:type II secretion system F family protein [Actinomycetes bacterium]